MCKNESPITSAQSLSCEVTRDMDRDNLRKMRMDTSGRDRQSTTASYNKTTVHD